MQVEDIIQLLLQNDKPTAHTVAQLDGVTERFPWFSIAYQLKLKAHYHLNDGSYDKQLPLVAARTTNREQLYNFIYLSAYSSDTASDDAKFSLQSDDFGTVEKPNETAFKAELSDDSQEASDYFSLEDSLADGGRDTESHEDLLNKFIAANPKIVPQVAPTSDDIVLSDSTKGIVSETLANIYVEQGLYSKAIEAYKELSLQNPEKRAYFAALIKKLKEKK